jgi:TldD protein
VLEPDVIDRVLAEAKRNGAPFAEIYVEDRRSTSVSFDDGRVDQVSNGRDRGAGIRVVRGETTGYAHTADLSEQGLIAAARAARPAGAMAGRELSGLLAGPPRGANDARW